jgi:hypothetical protein
VREIIEPMLNEHQTLTLVARANDEDLLIVHTHREWVDALFRAERDQDAKHDDPHLFQQLAPTVNGMWFVDLHRAMYSCQLAGDT